MIVLAATQEATTNSEPIAWIQVALIIFFAVFVFVVAGVLVRKKGYFDRAARIPLDDKEPQTPRSSGAEQ